MAKASKKYYSESTNVKDYFVDDYEDFGYDIANAKRYNNRNKKPRKFKDAFEDEY